MGKLLKLLGGVVAAGAFCGGVYYAYKTYKENKELEDEYDDIDELEEGFEDETGSDSRNYVDLSFAESEEAPNEENAEDADIAEAHSDACCGKEEACEDAKAEDGAINIEITD